ncbi:Hypothetical predicted protein [Octopus vulgaris]|uniref:Uncharacterized protein n=1 Tax=Octopus vulgaris TaxID=6645 RepID=A0AA36BKM0_OCTVU|nr:Hypothetical predicted protein [Octopus vulgaris]
MDFYIRPKRRPQGQKVTRKLNITKLKNQLTAQDLQSRMDSKLLDIRSDQSSIDEQWESFRDTVHSIALETLGQVTRNHQDWFDENDQEIQKLLEEKRRLLRAHQNDTTCTAKKAAFNSIRSTVQAKLRLMQDAWLSAKADEIQGYADKHDTKKFYEALKAVYGPQFSFGSTPLLSSDGTSLLTNKRLILERWAEHFNIVLNRPAQINEEAIARLPQVPTNHELAVPPAVEEKGYLRPHPPRTQLTFSRNPYHEEALYPVIQGPCLNLAATFTVPAPRHGSARELGKSEDMMQVAVRRISKPLQGYRLRQETSYSFGSAVPSRLRLD